MENDYITITYTFEFPKSKLKRTYDIRFERRTMILDIEEQKDKPEWAKLDFKKCSICPLKSESHKHCPLAMAVLKPIMDFKDNTSHERTTVTIITEERNYSKECALQKGLSSMLGLLMGLSGCPYFYKLKPLARFHLPFATIEETRYRVISSFLLRDYFLSRDNIDMSFNKLVDMYKKLETVNEDFAKRLLEATNMDSTLNAVVSLDVFAKSLPFSVKTKLESLEYLFDARTEYPFSFD